MINWHQYIWSHHYWIIFISVPPVVTICSCLTFMFFFWRPLKAWCAFEHLSLGHRWSLEAEKTSPAFESCFSRPLNRSNSPTENTPLQFLSILTSKFLITLWKEISPEINWCNYHVEGPIIFRVKHFWRLFISDNFFGLKYVGHHPAF